MTYLEISKSMCILEAIVCILQSDVILLQWIDLHLCVVHKKEGTFLIACPAAHSLPHQNWAGFFHFLSATAQL